MRVIDGLSVYDMAKKKPKSRQASKDASSDEVDSSSRCTHITKAISLPVVQKALKQRPFIEHCMDCIKDGLNQNADDGAGTDMSAWLCLQCAYQGCGRSSPHQHAMKHHQTPRSTSHCLVVSMQNWSCWCYDCDSEVLAEKYPPLLRAIEFVQKANMAALAGVSRKDQSALDTKETLSMSRKASDVHMVDSPATSGARANGCTPAASLVLPKLKGLNNLGNTCFMNAILQNLCQTHLLEHVLHDLAKKDATFTLPGFKNDLAKLCQLDLDHERDDNSSSSREQEQPLSYLEPLTVPMLSFGELTGALRGFIIDMNAAAKGNVVSPSNLFTQVCKKAPRFKGMQQQDSHELLRYLLDGMRNEDIYNRRRSILKLFNVRDSTGKDIDDEKKLRLKAYGVQLKHTFVDSIFGGHLLSSVVCLDCGHASQVFESFLDLSLPIAENKGTDVSSKYTYGESAAGRMKRITRSSKDEDSGIGSAASVVQPSKHQRKMLKQQLKKERKGKRGQSSISVAGQQPIGSGSSDPAVDQTDAFEVRDAEDDDRSCSSQVDATDDIDTETALPILPCISDATASQVLLCSGSVTKSNDECGNTPFTMAETTAVQPTSYPAAHGGDGDRPECSATEPPSFAEVDHEATGQVQGVTCLSQSEAFVAATNQQAGDVSFLVGDTTNHTALLQPSLASFPYSIDSGAPSLSYETLAKTMESLHIDNGGPHQAGGSITLATTDAELEDAVSAPQLSPECNTEAMPGHVIHGTDDLTPSREQATVIRDNLNSGMPEAAANPRCHREAESPDVAAAVKMSLVPLAPACKQVHTARTLQAYLERFTADEYLTGSNKFQCTSCSQRKHREAEMEEANCGASGGKREMVYTDAVKKLLVFSPPAVLTLHLKRFEQVGYATRKLDSHIEFPLVLDMAPFCSALCTGAEASQKHVLYSLYGVVEHVGQLNHGHYTAYVRARCAPGSAAAYAAAQKKFMQTELMNYEQPARTLVNRLIAIRSGEGLSPEPSETASATTGADCCPGMAHCSSADGQGHKLSTHANGSSLCSGKWFHVSDNNVREASESAVLACQAYILFYERID